ncbi:MAG: hypothetical protein B7Y39_17980 [Bdellovibrio sp. 28-41-41]|nr:MAG: hypothetical protein B7Y39_17980 [Bdellovibrio sp. 28-41-41]
MNFELKTITYLFVSLSIFGFQANADCLGSYSQIADQRLHDSDGGGTFLSIIGNGVPAFGGLATTEIGGAAFVPPVSGTTAAGGGTAGAITSGGAVAAAVPVISSGAYAVYAYKRGQAKKIVRLINEAAIGNGLMLLDVSTSLSKQLQKNVSVATVAATLTKANQANIFCPNSNTLYSQGDIYTFLSAELK